MFEKWKDIVIEDIIPKGLYKISNKGNLKRMYKYNFKEKKHVKYEHYRKVSKSNYCTISLINHFTKETYQTSIHRLVAMFFIPNEDKKKNNVHHIDGNPKNNNVKNLKWVTHRENIQYSIEERNKIRDIKIKNNKRRIKRELRNGGKYFQIAWKYGIPKHLVYKIKKEM